MRGERKTRHATSIKRSVSFARRRRAKMIHQHTAHKVGLNVQHFEWCPKYRYHMFRQDKYKKLCEECITQTAERHNIIIRVLTVMKEHIHISCELPLSMSQSKALQLLKGGSSYLMFRKHPKFRLRYPRGHFWSPGAYAGSVGYNTVEVVDAYVKNQNEVHQKTLTDFTGSPAL